MLLFLFVFLSEGVEVSWRRCDLFAHEKVLATSVSICCKKIGWAPAIIEPITSTAMASGITPKKPTQESTAPVEILFTLLVRSSQRK